MATANLGAAAFVYKGNWALGGGTGGNGAYKRMHVVRNNHSIWVAIVETEEEPTSTSSEWALMLENADEQAVIALISPSVSTGAITNITGVSASVAVNVQKFGFTVSPMVGVEYREQGQTAWLRTSTIAATTLGNISIPISGLDLKTAYEVRAFALDTKNPDISVLSPILPFSTTNAYIATPTLSITGGNTNISTTPTLTTSAFSTIGATDTHSATTWRVRNSGGTVVWESPNNTTNKTSITVPTGYLQPNTAYTFEVIHIGATLGSSAAGSLSATTANTIAVEYSIVAGGQRASIANYRDGGNGGQVINSSDNIQIGATIQVVIGGTDTDTSFGSVIAKTGLGGRGGTRGDGGGFPGTGGSPGALCIDGIRRGGGGGGGGGNAASGSGTDGGGNGGDVGHLDGYAGAPNTGGGGGGGMLSSGLTGSPGLGGSGIVIIRYAGTTPKASGGTITTSGGYTYHTFTASGTFTVIG